MHEIARLIARPIVREGKLLQLRSSLATPPRRNSSKYERLVNVCVKRGCSHEDAEDLVQEAHLRLFAYQRSETVRDPDSILRRIVINLTSNHYRDKQSTRILPRTIEELDRRGVLVDSGADPELTFAAEQELNGVLNLLSGINKRARQIFLAQRGGYSFEEIASAYGIKPRTVEKAVASAALEISTRSLEGSLIQAPVVQENARRFMEEHRLQIMKRNEAIRGVANKTERYMRSKKAQVVAAVETILMDGGTRSTSELQVALYQQWVEVSTNYLSAILCQAKDRFHSDRYTKEFSSRRVGWSLQPERLSALRADSPSRQLHSTVAVVINTTEPLKESPSAPSETQKTLVKGRRQGIRERNIATREVFVVRKPRLSKKAKITRAVESILMDGRSRTTRELQAELAQQGIDVPLALLSAYLSSQKGRISTDSKARGSRGKWGLPSDRLMTLQGARHPDVLGQPDFNPPRYADAESADEAAEAEVIEDVARSWLEAEAHLTNS